MFPISIHALTRSATIFTIVLNSGSVISIHALTRSATTKARLHWGQRSHFNPRTHEECDCRISIPRDDKVPFQSTHSRGVRQIPAQRSSKIGLFQSTHSRGVRLLIALVLTVITHISIHALTRSATAWSSIIFCVGVISIHALTRSATTKLRD